MMEHRLIVNQIEILAVPSLFFLIVLPKLGLVLYQQPILIPLFGSFSRNFNAFMTVTL